MGESGLPPMAGICGKAQAELVEHGTGLFGDLDADRDADLLDYHVLWDCLNGPNQEPPFGSCGPADIGNDGDVDLDDFAAFQNAFNSGE